MESLMHYSMISLLLMTAPPAEPISLTYKDQPLVEVIETRLAAVDELVKRRPVSNGLMKP